MSSDAVDDPIPAPTPSTSASTLSDDNDAVNTSDARVYFGPVLSPEKRLALDPANRKHTPVRRSTRLSPAPKYPAAHAASPNLALSTAETSSNLDQPQDRLSQEAFLEEPSSALATKVMRAWDNPSPPPSPSLPPQSSENLADLDPSSAAQIIEAPQIESETSESAVAAMLDTPVLGPPACSENQDPHSIPHESDPAQSSLEPQPDLIIFDPPPSSQNAQHQLQASAVSPPPLAESPMDDHEPPATVDELLSISPGRNSSSLGPSAAEVIVEEEVLPSDSLDIAIHSAGEDELATVKEDEMTQQGLPSECISPSQPTVAFVSVAEADESSTPLRRSSRQRRSVSPLVTPLVYQRSPSAVEGISTLPVSTSEPLLLSPRTGPSRRKSLKGKERELSLTLDAVIVEDDVTTSAEKSEESTAIPLSPRGRPNNERDSPHVRLRSLSPTSSGVLEQLVPRKSSDLFQLVHNNPFIPKPVFSLPPQVPPSDNKSLQLDAAEPTSLEPPRTPARRVPMSQAAKEGSLPSQSVYQLISPRKLDFGAHSVETIGTPAFRKVALDDPNRSPAKRIPITDALASAAKSKLSTAPGTFSTKSSLPRSKSEEPQPAIVSKGKRSASVEPTPPGAGAVKRFPPSALATPTKLPFPIAYTPTRITSTIPEADEPESVPVEQQNAADLSSPVKDAVLRQPPTRIESRIPRIGAKPYARPSPKPSAARQANVSSLHAASTSRPMKPTGEVSLPPKARVVRRATGKPTPSINNAVAGPGPRTQLQHAPSVATTAPLPPSVMNLKRKRDDEDRSSPTEHKPVVMIRKVTSNGTKATSSSRLPNGSSLDIVDTKSPEKARSPLPSGPRGAAPAQGKIQMRKVVTVKQRKSVSSPPPHNAPDDTVQDQSLLPIVQPQADAAVIPISGPSNDQQEETPTGVTIPAEPPGPPSALTPHEREQEQPSEPSPATHSEFIASPHSNVRRTPRRKAQTDVFGTVPPPAVKPSRRRQASVPEFGAFAGMSALALKSLTASNTLRNQQQVVELHTEVVRVESKRPDSPTTKVRTLLEKQKEEHTKERQARAERRAQRASGGSEMGDTPAPSSDVEEDEKGDQDAGMLLKHRRGAGEDEDYETPPRAERPIKRGRFEGDEGPVDDRRVKWDRGLSTTVYLDDSPPKLTRASRQEITKKGCLTPAAKTLRLDTMGNVLNALVPLADLVHENIIVKKFVYMDDPEPNPPPDPAVRSTRSKSKKAKS